MTDKQRQRRTAIHEAGHHFASWINGDKLGRLTLDDPSGNAHGSARSRNGTVPMTSGEVLALAAGELARGLFYPGETHNDGGHCRDWAAIRTLTPPDRLTLEMGKWWSDNQGADVDAFIEAFREQLTAPLRTKKAKRAIRALARILLERRTLSGRESAVILEANYGGLPAGALPIGEHSAMTGGDPHTHEQLIERLTYHVEAMERHLKGCRWGSDDLGEIMQHRRLEAILTAFTGALAYRPQPEGTDEAGPSEEGTPDTGTQTRGISLGTGKN